MTVVKIPTNNNLVSISKISRRPSLPVFPLMTRTLQRALYWLDLLSVSPLSGNRLAGFNGEDFIKTEKITKEDPVEASF